ncbi:hypothetical protein ABB29_07845 [Pseudoxanthomonas dokdonensis]|uniref:2-hydroxychromene-2-carboxylate isomerase n=2 Tax=Pseudoxanthomonas dokdonensis TaxID=344882 RepID=A0A0R0CXY2_9GAMM|nr:hypothetical protein ABB29_07845 [Pseudoxanthomonas dokdonensis]
MSTVDYFFSLLSPWAYLGHPTLLEVAASTGAGIRYRPMQFQPVLAAAGGQALKDRPLARQHYRLIELQRWRAQRGLPLDLQPRFFPVDVSLADRVVIALVQAGKDPAGYVGDAGRALWAEQGDLSDRALIGGLLERHGLPASELLAAADGEQAGNEYQANTQAAIAAGLPGMPAYVLDGEVFWGQDRLDMLQGALRSPRPPYRIP